MPVSKKSVGYSELRRKQMKKLTGNAKKLQRQNPNLTWQQAIKKAGASIKGAKVSKPKTVVKKVGAVTTKSKQHTDKNKITANIQVGAKTSAVNASIYALRDLAQTIQRIAQVEKMIDYERKTQRLTKNKQVIQHSKSLVKQHQKELALLRKQRTLQKQRV